MKEPLPVFTKCYSGSSSKVAIRSRRPSRTPIKTREWTKYEQSARGTRQIHEGTRDQAAGSSRTFFCCLSYHHIKAQQNQAAASLRAFYRRVSHHLTLLDFRQAQVGACVARVHRRCRSWPQPECGGDKGGLY